MQVRVEADDVLAAAGHLLGRSEAGPAQVARCAAVTSGLRDPALRAGVTTLADVAADALELVTADLALLATKVRAGALLYTRVEGAVAGALVP